MNRRNVLLATVTGLTVILIYLIFSDALPQLRGPSPGTNIWFWPYLLRPVTRWLPAFSTSVFILIIMGGWLSEKKQQFGGRWLILLATGSFLLQLNLIYADRPQPLAELVDRTLAVQTGGYFWTAAHIEEIGTTLNRYPQAMSEFASDHARTHPPGLVILNWLTLRLFQFFPQLSQQIAHIVWPMRCTDLWLLNSPPYVAAALGIWAIFPLLAAAFTVFPTYKLGKAIGGIQGAKLGAGLVAGMPALLIFTPLADQFFAFLTPFIFYTFIKGISKQESFTALDSLQTAPAWLFLSGFFFSLSTFLSLGNGAIFLGIIIFAILWSWLNWKQIPQGESASLTFRGILVWSSGAILIWLLYWLFWGVPPWTIVQTGLAEHFSATTSQRNYLTWLIFNPLDLLIFAGMPAFLGFLLSLFTNKRCHTCEGRVPFESQAWISVYTGMRRFHVFTASTAILLIGLLISGSTRGEVGRIWLFLMPLIGISAGIYWTRVYAGNWKAQHLIITLQLGIALALGLAWKPMGAVIVVAEEPEMPAVAKLSQPTIPANIHFDDQITLDSYSITPNPSTRQLDVTLVWQATRQVLRPYTIFAHLLAADGTIVAQHDSWSVAGQWPPTCWQSGEQIVDQFEIPIAEGGGSQIEQLRIGLYDKLDGSRLYTANGEDNITLPIPNP